MAYPNCPRAELAHGRVSLDWALYVLNFDIYGEGGGPTSYRAQPLSWPPRPRPAVWRASDADSQRSDLSRCSASPSSANRRGIAIPHMELVDRCVLPSVLLLVCASVYLLLLYTTMCTSVYYVPANRAVARANKVI